MSPREKPIPNSYWLPGGRVVAGEYPGDLAESDARAKIAALLGAGVTAFIDLTSEADRMVSYESVLAVEATRLGVSATRVSLPVRDMDVAVTSLPTMETRAPPRGRPSDARTRPANCAGPRHIMARSPGIAPSLTDVVSSSVMRVAGPI